MADTLVNRLRGQYEIGQNNEFGTRSFSEFIPPISLEAAERIEKLECVLAWYGQEASAISKAVDNDGNPTDAVLASLAVLKLDAGNRARELVDV